MYVETTIPSFYAERRTAPEIVARRKWTRQWWADASERYELVTSAAVLDELVGDIPERSAQRQVLVHELPLVPVEPAIGEIVQTYIRHKVMPTDPGGDALHLALASFHRCDLEAEMKQSQADPVIDEIREVRHRISARVDDEPARLVAYYIELQKRYRDRFVAAVRVAEPVDGSTPELGVSDRRR